MIDSEQISVINFEIIYRAVKKQRKLLNFKAHFETYGFANLK